MNQILFQNFELITLNSTLHIFAIYMSTQAILKKRERKQVLAIKILITPILLLRRPTWGMYVVQISTIDRNRKQLFRGPFIREVRMSGTLTIARTIDDRRTLKKIQSIQWMTVVYLKMHLRRGRIYALYIKESIRHKTVPSQWVYGALRKIDNDALWRQ